MRKFLLIAVIMFSGCAEPRLQPPAKSIVCPVCSKQAKLDSFDNYEVEYVCDDEHKTEINHKTGELNRSYNKGNR